MERNLKVYQKMKKIWNIRVSGNQEKLKAYQMAYTIPYGISEKFFSWILGILWKLFKIIYVYSNFFSKLFLFYLQGKEETKSVFCSERN